ncbi:hypothetical protein [Streptomyces sp. W1SF4]|uniref:hypothetical protein n=1 Tax=Streptomyces sp. W1SF4 TaxID=2305220 RepID=UPI000F6F4890|nr:hypothetical protein [Streptomyces sp. W1SF4]AZM93771.1 hypothetical protein D1J60_35180 [Streptomyces sp. W1SF4]
MLLREDGPPDTVEGWGIRNSRGNGSPASVLLFEVPEGWDTEDDSLRSLEDSGKYVVKVNGSIKGNVLKGRLGFSSEELTSLRAGQVLTSTEGKRVMSREKFLKADPARCKQ